MGILFKDSYIEFVLQFKIFNLNEQKTKSLPMGLYFEVNGTVKTL